MTELQKTRFWSHVKKTQDCWYWLLKPTMYGYGQFKLDKKTLRSHRLSYELIVGNIPDGLCLDHLCKNRMCVNPEHLEPVTNRENVLRGSGITAINSKKTICHMGHKLNGNNLYIAPKTGKRNCRKCRALAVLKWRGKHFDGQATDNS